MLETIARSVRAKGLSAAISAASLALGLGYVTAASAQTPIEIKLTNCTRNDPGQELMEMMKKGMDESSGGRLSVKLFGGCQLGSMQRMIEGVQLGTLEMTVTPTAFAVSVDPNFQVPDAPGHLKDVHHAHRAYRVPAFRQKFMDLAKPKGMTMVNIWAYSPTAYASHRPIRTLDDFKGLKVRVLATKTETALMSGVGASGVPIDFAELLPALERRTVDAVRSSIVVMAALKYYDVAKNVTPIDDGMITQATLVNTAFFNRLPQDLRDIILKVASDVETKIPDVTAAFGARAEARWKEGGGSVWHLSESDKAEFNRRARAVGDEYLASNPETREVYALFKEAAASTR